MLNIYQSHLTEVLFDALTRQVASRPAGMSPLTPELVLVQNPDMAQWLKMELAQSEFSCGIAANIHFPLPSAFMWRLFKSLFKDDLPEESPFTKDKLTWQLMTLLPTFLDNPHFAWARRYLVAANEDENEDEYKNEQTAENQQSKLAALDEQQFRLYQLCGQIADIFDQYLMYRPDWVAEWEQGEGLKDVPSDHQWQPVLWQALAASIAKRANSDLHRGRLLREAIDKLLSGDKIDLSDLPPRISIFGISSMPEQTLLLLNALAKHIDIHWFQMNPCSEFWLDIIDPKTKAKLSAAQKFIYLDDLEEDRYFLVGNPLLASMGTLGREHLSLMYEQLEGDLIENELEQSFPTTGALAVLQNEIYQLHNRGQFEALNAEQLDSNIGKIALSDNDLSNIQFHNSYSAMREVEVLKDALLALFEQDPTLQPNDVLVMMPDGASYAPYINAVFAFHNDNKNFPYSINDLSITQESPLMDSLLALFNLPESRMSVSDVIAILEVPAVLNRFAIDEDELDKIKLWLSESGVNWGRDAQHRASLGLVPFEQNSWQFGLRRMLSGYAMHPAQGIYDDTLPYLEIEGSASTALGKLLMFIDCLDHYRPLMQESRSAEQWSTFVADIIHDFYLCDGDEQVLMQKATALVEGIEHYCDEVSFEQPISRLVVRDYLIQSLSKAQSSKRFRAGCINFSTLMPMRSIPFKVICLLGMNEGDFPRRNQTVSFDLMAQQRRRGDRSGRLDDRYLFLEALLSCRQHLHISWVGKDIRNDSELPPSILISELMDYITEAWILERDVTTELSSEKAGKHLIAVMSTAHPLQPFNASYFKKDAQFASYSNLWSQSLNQTPQAEFADCKLPLMADDQQDLVEFQQIELRQIEALLINPCQAFMQRRLGVYIDDVDELLSDSEPFDCSALQKWQLKDELYRLLKQRNTNEESIKQFNEIKMHQGALPVGLAGRSILNDCSNDAQTILNIVPANLLCDDASQELRLKIDNHVIVTSITQPQNSQIASIKIGSMKPKDKLRTWLRHLMACACGLEVNSLLIDKSHVLDLPAVPKERAIALLTDYLTLYFEGLSRPLPFFINTAEHYAKASMKGDVELSVLYDKWQDDLRPYNCDGFDHYIRRCYPELEPVIDDFMQYYQAIYQPMLPLKISTHKQYFK